MPAVVEYRIVYVREGHIPAYDRTVPTSDFADVFLDGSRRVGAVMPSVNGLRDTLWSERHFNGFEPCRLADGSLCH